MLSSSEKVRRWEVAVAFRASGVWVRGGLGIEESLVVIVLALLFFFPRRLFTIGGER